MWGDTDTEGRGDRATCWHARRPSIPVWRRTSLLVYIHEWQPKKTGSTCTFCPSHVPVPKRRFPKEEPAHVRFSSTHHLWRSPYVQGLHQRLYFLSERFDVFCVLRCFLFANAELKFLIRYRRLIERSRSTCGRDMYCSRWKLHIHSISG